MPSSDLNITVHLMSREMEELPKEALVYQFGDELSKQLSIISKWTIEKRASLIVAKAEMTKAFFSTRVEILFKFGQTHLQHKNEDIISKYLQHYPISRPVYLIVRNILNNSELVNPSTGGLNSLSLMSMIVALLPEGSAVRVWTRMFLSPSRNSLE